MALGLLPDENGLYRIDDMTGDMMLTKEQMLRNYGMKIKLPLVTSLYIVVFPRRSVCTIGRCDSVCKVKGVDLKIHIKIHHNRQKNAPLPI